MTLATTDSVRTDLAVERHQAPHHAVSHIAPETTNDERIQVTKLHVHTEEMAQKSGVPIGQYITLDVPEFHRADQILKTNIEKEGIRQLSHLLRSRSITAEDSLLIVGLGNRRVTPDALGPRVIEGITVTRHWPQLFPNWSGYRIVSAIAPGVLGITGMETSEVVHSLVLQMKPKAVILIDALASRSLARVYTTIQISDAGLRPGSGVGNHRQSIDERLLGIPVFVLGVPTVVYASTIVQDTLDAIESAITAQTNTPADVLGILSTLSSAERKTLAQEVLAPAGHDLVVTPKEVDQLIEDMAHLLAHIINGAIQPSFLYASPDPEATPTHETTQKLTHNNS